MSNYEVRFIIVRTVVVTGAHDADDAVEQATNELSMDMAEGVVEANVEPLEDGESLDRAKRHADEVLELDEEEDNE